MTKYVIKTVGNQPFNHPDKFGWGDDGAADCFLVSQKFNPNHKPGGGSEGGRFTTQGDQDPGAKKPPHSDVMFEVAPDPNDKELTARWNKLSDEDKLAISREVAGDITPDVLHELKAEGVIEDQIGGYLGATNPSLALDTEADKAVEAAKLLGYALSQDSMMVVSSTPVDGLDEVGAVVLHVPKGEQSIEAMTKIYDRLYELADGEGNKLIGGYSMSKGRMVMLNFSDIGDDALAELVDKQMDGQYSIHHEKAYAAFIDKKDYANAGDPKTDGGRSSVWQRRADYIRSKASDAIEAHLAARKKETQARKRQIRVKSKS